VSARLIGVCLVAACAVIEACGQVFLKNAAASQTKTQMRRIWIAAGIACFAAEAIVWSYVLRMLEVSVAYPMSSLSFVAVTILSSLILQERVSKERWFGVFLIIAGTALVGIA
jgi:undecaprenyl phosphate-alpha-L-ara4N flippase subunit ArnE